MANPVQLRIRGSEDVREKFKQVEGKVDPDTYGDLVVSMCEFILENESEFKRYATRESKESAKSDERR